MTWIRSREKGLRLRCKGISGSQRSLLDIETRKGWTPAWRLEQLSSRLWLSGRLCAEDGRAVTAPHRANWLAANAIWVPKPTGTCRRTWSRPSSKLHPLCEEWELHRVIILSWRFCFCSDYLMKFQCPPPSAPLLNLSGFVPSKGDLMGQNLSWFTHSQPHLFYFGSLAVSMLH